jgi:hypothetical protein
MIQYSSSWLKLIKSFCECILLRSILVMNKNNHLHIYNVTKPLLFSTHLMMAQLEPKHVVLI